MESLVPQGETDILPFTIAKERVPFARLAAAAQACTDPRARRLYGQLALSELRRPSTLASRLNDPADGLPAQPDLALSPLAHFPDPLPQTEEAILRFDTEKEPSPNCFGILAKGVDRKELLRLLEYLGDDEAGHRTRLLSLLNGMGADGPVAAARMPAPGCDSFAE